jgi:hypothetical protein
MSKILSVAIGPGSPLAEGTEKIRTLLKQTGTNIIEIGKELIRCKKIAGHGNWLP